jgi:hypothetical protein
MRPHGLGESDVTGTTEDHDGLRAPQGMTISSGATPSV